MRFLFLAVLGLTCSNLFGQSFSNNLRLSSSFMDLRSSTNKLSAYKTAVWGVEFSSSVKMSKWTMVEGGMNWNSVGLIYDSFDKVVIKLHITDFFLSYHGFKSLSRKKLMLFGVGACYGLVVNYYSPRSNSALLPVNAINYRLYSMFISMGYIYQLSETMAITLDSKLHYGIKRIVPDSASPLIYSISIGIRFGKW